MREVPSYATVELCDLGQVLSSYGPTCSSRVGLCYGDGRVIWKTFAFKHLFISGITPIRAHSQGNQGPLLANLCDPRHKSREISPLRFAASSSRRPRRRRRRRRRVRYSQGRPVSLRRRRGPALLSPGPPIPALPTCPSAWAHPALRLPHPGGAARPRVPRSTCSRQSLRLSYPEAPAEPEA